VSFESALMQNAQVKAALSADELKAALDPTTYIGRAPEIVDEVVQAQRTSGWLK